MLKEHIKYTDFNGMEREEDFYFNLTKVELMRMQTNVQGGLEAKLKRIIAAEDGAAIMEVVEDLIRRSYGKKTNDGGFIKRPEYVDEFVSTEAYSELFMKLVTDSKATTAFVKGILPTDMQAQIANKIEK